MFSFVVQSKKGFPRLLPLMGPYGRLWTLMGSPLGPCWASPRALVGSPLGPCWASPRALMGTPLNLTNNPGQLPPWGVTENLRNKIETAIYTCIY